MCYFFLRGMRWILIASAQHFGNLLYMSEWATGILKAAFDSWGYSRENAHYIEHFHDDAVEISTKTYFYSVFLKNLKFFGVYFGKKHIKDTYRRYMELSLQWPVVHVTADLLHIFDCPYLVSLEISRRVKKKLREKKPKNDGKYANLLQWFVK